MTNYHTPAFPNAKVIINGLDEQDGVSGYSPGMTLLDHFAGLAMQSLINVSFKELGSAYVSNRSGLLAQASYVIANAMLKERQSWIK